MITRKAIQDHIDANESRGPLTPVTFADLTAIAEKASAVSPSNPAPTTAAAKKPRSKPKK